MGKIYNTRPVNMGKKWDKLKITSKRDQEDNTIRLDNGEKRGTNVLENIPCTDREGD